MIVWMKACQRCKTGDLHLKSDMYGKYIQCIQCGFTQDLKVDKGAEKEPAGKPKAKAASTTNR